ncbi:MAG: hypothetical protein RPU64_11535 [Candidatus Sedimenticola sp. (ex Thyasira tokunagai)]
MAKNLSAIVPMILLLLLSACSGDPGTGAKEVKWDRDACERCRMVLSDRVHSAQVRFYPVGGKRSKELKFDDIGCAALWLEDKPFKDDSKTEIWVTDHRSGDWIDARKAHYVKGHLTPMEYGLGAQLTATPDSLDYSQALEDIHNTEEHFNAHGVDLLERLNEQKKRREAAQASPQQITEKTDQ